MYTDKVGGYDDTISVYDHRLETAWEEYIDALEDHTVPYSRVLELRSVYECILNEKHDVTPCQ